MRHELKIDQHFLIRLLEGKKTFEVRKNDRDYQVGDTIQFLPLESKTLNVYDYCERIPEFLIIYVHTGLGMEDGYCVLGVATLKDAKQAKEVSHENPVFTDIVGEL